MLACMQSEGGDVQQIDSCNQAGNQDEGDQLLAQRISVVESNIPRTVKVAHSMKTQIEGSARRALGAEINSNLNRPREVIQDFIRFSESKLWSFMMDFYDKEGIQSWSKGIVPHFITSNTFIAKAYARILISYLSDLHKNGDLNMHEKIYLIELGGGSGKLCFYILQALEKLKAHVAFPIENIVYLLTDFTESTIAFWQTHADFKPFLDQGKLDFCRYDAVNDTDLHLLRSGICLRKGEIKNPICVLANYVADTLCHDIFQFNNGMLMEGLVSVGSNIAQNDDSNIINHFENEYLYQPVRTTYYDEKTLEGEERHYQRMLEWYSSYFSRNDTSNTGASLLMPVGFLNAMHNLSNLSDGNALIIVGDKGSTDPDSFRGLNDPYLAIHGSFSVMVNFHAINMYCISKGGFSLLSEQEEALQVNCFVLSGCDEHSNALDILRFEKQMNTIPAPCSKFPLLHDSFREYLRSFTPNDFYNIQKCLKEESNPSIVSILSLMRLSDWDPDILFKFRDDIQSQIPALNPRLKNDLCRGLENIWQHYYLLDHEKDIAFEIARTYYGLQKYQEALKFYGTSIKLHGDHYVSFHNQGLCFYNLNDLKSAKILFQKSLNANPSYVKASKWIQKVTKEMTSEGK